MKNKLIIKADIPEQQFMESMLNQRFAGYNISFMFFIYALAHSWHFTKLNYYMKLLEMY